MSKLKNESSELKAEEPKPKHPGGRPTDYTLELAKEICEQISSSSFGIKRLCKINDNWPSHNTIYKWLMLHKEFSDLYAQAKKSQIEVLVDELVDISDDISKDETFDNQGNIVPNNEFINRSRVRIDTRKWLASKLIPRLYGDRITQEHVGKDGAPIKIKSEEEIDLSALSDEELKAYRDITAKLKQANEAAKS